MTIATHDLVKVATRFTVDLRVSLGFREARFEKLEIEKLHFEAGSFVLELLSF